MATSCAPGTCGAIVSSFESEVRARRSARPVPFSTSSKPGAYPTTTEPSASAAMARMPAAAGPCWPGACAPRRRQRRLYLSALQSELFNAWLDARIDDGLYDRVIEGDLLQRQGGHATFVADMPNAQQPRLDAGEVDVTGPIFGPRMRRPQGHAAEREAAVLAAADLEIDAFRAGGKDALGTRRPSRVFLRDLEVAADAEDLLLSFTLPRGAYATVVLDQILR